MGLLLHDLAADTAVFLSRQVVHDPHHEANSTASAAGTAAESSYCSSSACKRNWRIVFAVLLFLEGLVFGYVALLLRRFASISTKRFRKFLHFVNVGGGGIFLATGLLHILPEAVALLSGEPHVEPPHEPGHVEPGHVEPAHAEPSHAEHAAKFPTAFAVVLGMYFLFLFFDKVLFAHVDKDEKPIIGPLVGDDDKSEDAEVALQESLDEEPIINGFGSAKFFSSVITVIGIAAHSLFESIVLGSSRQFSTILNTFIAISAHRWATSMALGSRFAKDNLAVGPYSLLTVLFSLVAPVGILIGVAVQETSEVFQGVIFALSAGTFIYIGAFETTAEEFVAHRKWFFWKFFVMFCGAGLMLIITGILVALRIH